MSTELISLLLSLFLGHPYVASTLEPKVVAADPAAVVEPLIVNTDSVDCTTLVEYVTAARLCGMSDTIVKSDSAFLATLQGLRFREGRRGNYATRKHYFSEWIEEAEAKGWVSDISATLTGAKELQKEIHFMSQHPQSYPQLEKCPQLVDSIRVVEQRLSQKKVWFVPKENIAKTYEQLKHGDIVVFLTSIGGLDVQHVGFVWKPDEKTPPHLYHASSAQHKVVVDQRTIGEYAMSQKTITGIRVVRIAQHDK